MGEVSPVPPEEVSPVPPEKVAQAIKLLYSVLGISIIRLVWTIFSHIDVRTPFMMILNSIMIYAVFGFLVYKLGQRKSWARTGVAAIFAISIPLSVLPMFQSISHSIVVNGLGLLSLVIYTVALVWLFQQDSTTWFREL
jgi:hypothetical protein